MQGLLSYMACLLCVAHHNRHEQNFQSPNCVPIQCVVLNEVKLFHMCDLSAETISCFSELPQVFEVRIEVSSQLFCHITIVLDC